MPTKSESPVFPKEAHTLRSEDKAKAAKKPKVQSRDTREDRGTRQSKNAKNAQTLSHGK